MQPIHVIPARFRQEPIDVAAYDRYHDTEGFEGQGKRLRRAWDGYRGEWRAARDAELSQSHASLDADWLDTLDGMERAGMARARALGARCGYCSAQQRHAATDRRQLAAFWRWRQRVMRHAPLVWSLQWAVIDGDDLPIVAARVGSTTETLGGQMRMVWRWLFHELYSATLR